MKDRLNDVFWVFVLIFLSVVYLYSLGVLFVLIEVPTYIITGKWLVEIVYDNLT